MKLIKAGKLKPEDKPNWVGIPIRCPKCEAEWELEAGDEKNSSLMEFGSFAKQPLALCPTKGCREKVLVSPLTKLSNAAPKKMVAVKTTLPHKDRRGK